LSNGSGNCEKINTLFDQGVITEDERRSMRSGNGGNLNPDWEEALMGYPLGWTDIDKESDFTNHYPEKWFDNTWEDNLPRIKKKKKYRRKRIMALGNSVVPQITKMIFERPCFDDWRK
jgi:hypothetical protein